jgi:hypothetical protein
MARKLAEIVGLLILCAAIVVVAVTIVSAENTASAAAQPAITAAHGVVNSLP